jgi:site-specific DNA recombinase
MLTSFLANAELFLDQVKAGWNAAKARAVARGVHIGPTPIGYRREKSMPLIPHPTYGPAITELYKAAKTAKSDTALARWMTERAPREDGPAWKPSEIRRWLKNRIYLGEVRYGALENTAAHPPLTDPETFKAVQREPGAQQRNGGASFLLSGLIRCAGCRYAMAGSNQGGAKRNTRIYRCSRSDCPESALIVGARIEDHVVGEVRDHLQGLRLKAADPGVDVEKLEREAAEARAELEAFASDLEARRMLGEQGWQDALRARAEDRDRRVAALDEAVGSRRLLAVAEDVDDLDHEALRDLLHGMIRVIFVRRAKRGASAAERGLIVWSDDPRLIDVPGPHRSGPYEPIRW